MRDATTEHFDQLDGLRACAVGAVMLWHFSPAASAVIPWGPLGVELFFVISGFLITGILLRCRDLVDAGMSRAFVARRFYARRCLRILPIYYLTILVAAALDVAPLRATLLWHLTYTTNVYVAWTDSWPGPFAHFWSLATEEQFYLFWPWLVLGLPRAWLAPAIWGLVAVAVLFRTACAALGLWWWLGHYVLLPGSLDTLGLGALLALDLARRRDGTCPRYLTSSAGMVGAFAAVAGGQMIRLWGASSSWVALATTCDAVFFAWLVGRAAFTLRGIAGSTLESRALRGAGRISYGLYVYHPFVLVAVPAASTALGWTAPAGEVGRVVLLAAATALVASVSWRLVETPLNALKHRFPYVAALACIGLALGARPATAAPPARWSVVVEGGVAWLRTPAGARFYSKGVNVVEGAEENAKSRAGLDYHWRRFAPTLRDWRRDTERRLTSWGFNTRGGWSDPARDFTLPLTIELDLGRHAKLHWFDPFNPAAEETARRTAEELTAPYKGDARLIGYFTDNETGWWNSPLFLWYLRADWSNHTKRALWALLVEHYHGEWPALLADWVPDAGVTSFDGLRRAGARLRLRPGGGGMRVIERFTYVCARRYYEVVHDAVRAAQPDALILGDRLPLYYDQDAVRAMAEFVDVVSTNYDVDVPDGWVAPYYFDSLRRLTGKPILVSEFFFAADENRSGNLNLGHLMTVPTQEERARGAARAMESFARFPNVVGAHWFQYYDEPFGGRSDGEDYNMGLVDTTNRPYPALVAALGRANATVEALHRKSGAPAPPEPDEVALPLARRPIDLADDSLTDWDKDATRLRGFATPPPSVPFGDVHVAWRPEGLYLASLASNYVDLDLLAYEGEFPRSEAFQLRVAIVRDGARHEFTVYLTPRESTRFADRLEITPQLYGTKDWLPVERLPDDRVAKLARPLPHIALEAFLPAASLGTEVLAPGMRLDLHVEVVSFYRERTMTWSHPVRLSGGAATPALSAPTPPPAQGRAPDRSTRPRSRAPRGTAPRSRRRSSARSRRRRGASES